MRLISMNSAQISNSFEIDECVWEMAGRLETEREDLMNPSSGEMDLGRQRGKKNEEEKIPKKKTKTKKKKWSDDFPHNPC